MDVNPDVANALGLQSEHAGTTYLFCGRVCKLDFDEDPGKYLASDYVPSM
jgi:YHS domain-containing protein